jgi:hypothetical protein
MRRFARAAPFALALAASGVQGQTTDVATLLQSVENCLAWRNAGFPGARTPFAGGFDVIEPFGGAGPGVYREADTGFEITLTRAGDTAVCESTAGTIALGEAGLDALAMQLADRVADGRAVPIAPDRYAFCAEPPGLLRLRDTGDGATFRIEFGTDAALAQAGGCGT